MPYSPIPKNDVPPGARFTAPRGCQGQMYEVEYSAGNPRQKDESGHGDLYRRTRDLSIGPERGYFRYLPRTAR